eukprot:gene13264-13394_t
MEPTPAGHGSLASDEPSDSEKDDLAAFLAGLKKRYNIEENVFSVQDASVGDAKAASASAAAFAAAPDTAAHASSPARASSRNEVSSDADILNLHPAFRATGSRNSPAKPGHRGAAGGRVAGGQSREEQSLSAINMSSVRKPLLPAFAVAAEADAPDSDLRTDAAGPAGAALDVLQGKQASRGSLQQYLVLREFQRRDVTMAQLLAERDQLRREALRTTAEAARLEKQRDEATRTAERAEAELADVQRTELPALEARHKQAAARSASELAKIKQALREAEQAAVAAQQAAVGQNQAALQQQQLAELCKEKERLSVELDRLASELTRHKLLAREAEKAAAVAQATAKQSSDQVSLLERELREARQQHQEEVTALMAELSKSRHATREAEVRLAAHKSDAASEGDELQGMRRTLAAERTRHEEQQLPPGPGAADNDLAAALSRAVRAEAAVADAESALVSLRYRVLQLEASNSRREQEVETVKERLAEKVAREERRLASDKRAYARIRQAYASSRRSGLAAVGAQRAAAGAVAAAARELRPIELVGLYESQKEVLEQEAATAKAEDLSLCVRSEAAAALREAAKRIAAAEAKCSSLADDVTALQQELNSRPTHAQHRQLQREVDILQRKIASLRREQALAAPGGAAVAGEDSLAAAGGAWPPGEGAPAAAAVAVAATRSARAAIQRDKAIAQLGLAVVEEFPRDVLVDLVQDVCVVLELKDATLLVPNLRKMSAVMGAIPRLEAFVAQVCELCFRQGLMYVPEELVQDLNPGAVPKVLQHWINLLQQGEQLQQLVDHLQQLLSLRCGSEGPPTPDNAPDSTTHLVYVHYNELLNFFKAVAVSLALPADAGPQTAMIAINNLVRLSDRQPTKVRLAAAQLQQAAGISQKGESAGHHAAAMAAGDGARAAHHQSTATGQAELQALLAAVGAGSVRQAVTSFKDMKQRLERLDQVLPRYQNMASQLYDRLRVVALDEVIPALDRTLAQAAS